MTIRNHINAHKLEHMTFYLDHDIFSDYVLRNEPLRIQIYKGTLTTTVILIVKYFASSGPATKIQKKRN